MPLCRRMMRIATLMIALLSPLVTRGEPVDPRAALLLGMGLMNACLAQDAAVAKAVLDRMVIGFDDRAFWNGVPDQEREAMAKYQSSFPSELRSQQHKQAIFTFVESEWAACVRKKQWLSKKLCEDFLPYFKNQDFQSLPIAFERNLSEIKSKEELFTYTNNSFGRPAPAASCPQ